MHQILARLGIVAAFAGALSLAPTASHVAAAQADEAEKPKGYPVRTYEVSPKVLGRASCVTRPLWDGTKFIKQMPVIDVRPNLTHTEFYVECRYPGNITEWKVGFPRYRFVLLPEYREKYQLVRQMDRDEVSPKGDSVEKWFYFQAEPRPQE